MNVVVEGFKRIILSGTCRPAVVAESRVIRISREKIVESLLVRNEISFKERVDGRIVREGGRGGICRSSDRIWP